MYWLMVFFMPCGCSCDEAGVIYSCRDHPDCSACGLPRVAVEAGVTDYWRKYVGAIGDPTGAVVGIDRFGESAPAAVLFKHFGFTVDHVVAAVRNVLG